MEIKHIKDLMAAMGKTGTKRLQITQEEFELILEREDGGVVRVGEAVEWPSENPMKSDMDYHRVISSPSTDHGRSKKAVELEEGAEDITGSFITSPMVGTFYLSPSSEDPPFVKVGDQIEKDTVVCIVEAMKVMNEVKAGLSGTIAEVLVENGHPIEFGTKLFRIK